jgi:lysozyme
MNTFLQALLRLFTAIFGATPAKPPEAPQRPAQRLLDLSLLKEFEGLRLSAYKDVGGVWTIGYGHTKTAKEGMRITEAGAEALLLEDIAWVTAAIDRYVKVQITDNQYSALVSFIYNVGAGAFRGSTMLRHINNKSFNLASDEFPKWNKVKGKTVKGLTNRRLKEQELFRK